MSLAERYEAFLLDLDGVLYRGDTPVEGGAGAVPALRRLGRVLFVTNNSAPTPATLAAKLRSMGIDAHPEDVVTSAQAAAPIVRDLVGEGATAFVVGEAGVREALEEAGLEIARPDAIEADAVVVGWDRTADYDKLRLASVLVQRGARLVATNSDASYPAPGGELWPGTGALLAVIETTTGVRAEVAGKPHPPLYEAALQRAGTKSALAVGDRLETDVAGAAAAGLDAALVLTGAATLADLLDHDALPVAVVPSLSGILEDRPRTEIRRAGEADDFQTLVREAGLKDLPGDSTRLVTDEGSGTAAIRVRGADAYLHSIAVAGAARGDGRGTLLTAAAARAAARAGARTAYLVTEDADGFFARLGFVPLGRDELPSWIQEISAECAERASAMRRPLAQSPQGSV